MKVLRVVGLLAILYALVGEFRQRARRRRFPADVDVDFSSMIIDDGRRGGGVDAGARRRESGGVVVDVDVDDEYKRPSDDERGDGESAAEVVVATARAFPRTTDDDDGDERVQAEMKRHAVAAAAIDDDDESYIVDVYVRKAEPHERHVPIPAGSSVNATIGDVAVLGDEPSEQHHVPISSGASVQRSKSIDPAKQRIILLGERHSGAELIANHLTTCFDIEVTDTYKRYGYWFQEEDLTKVPRNSAVVVSVFRDPYTWVEAMRIEPLHAHDHLKWIPVDDHTNIDRSRTMGWRDFVTQPWIGQRGITDRITGRTNRGMDRAICMDSYSYRDAAPCSRNDSPTVEGLGEYKYEYQRDGSERGYSSIVDLRREKVLNHLSVADFIGTKAFIPMRYEDMDDDGMRALITSLEEATGSKARCNATVVMAPNPLAQRKIPVLRELPGDYIMWMDRFVDWEVESRIGYSRRGGADAPDKNAIEVERDDAIPTMSIESSMSTTRPVEKIILLGERHSGTNWITDHLTECFDIKVTNTYKRYKHWFQEEDLTKVPENSAVVVAMFRDPYNWVEAMRVEPHHAHDHLRWYRDRKNLKKSWKTIARPMEWKEFVTQPWIGARGLMDENITETQGGMDTAVCMDSYSFYDAAPCSQDDSEFITGLGEYKYENQHDGSERGYSSIIDLRREKIINHLSVADFRGTRAFLPFRFEDLNENGTSGLIKSVEDATGLKARCNATVGKAPRRRLVKKRITKHKELTKDFIKWMNRFVDWEVESTIGYSKRH